MGFSASRPMLICSTFVATCYEVRRVSEPQTDFR